MNKKTKILSSIMCGLLLSSNLALTSVQAKSTKNANIGTTNTKSEYEQKFYMEKDGDIIELSDKDLADMGLYINRKTLQVTELKNKGIMQPMDIEEGSYFEFYCYLTPAKLNKLYAKIGLGGATTTTLTALLAKLFPGLGDVAILAGFISAVGIAALQSADEGNGVKIYRLNTNRQIFTVLPA